MLQAQSCDGIKTGDARSHHRHCNSHLDATRPQYQYMNSFESSGASYEAVLEGEAVEHYSLLARKAG